MPQPGTKCRTKPFSGSDYYRPIGAERGGTKKRFSHGVQTKSSGFEPEANKGWTKTVRHREGKKPWTAGEKNSKKGRQKKNTPKQ